MGEKSSLVDFFPLSLEIVVSTSISGLLKSCTSFLIERSEIRKKQHDFKCVHFKCRMVLFECGIVFFYTIWEKSRHSMKKFNYSRLFSNIVQKRTILHLKWTLVKSCCFFLIFASSDKKARA